MALSTNLVTYWKLDGNSNDSISTNNGTDTAITYNAGNGIIVQGAGFNGTTSHIAIANSTDFNFGTGSFSFSAWIKTTVTGSIWGGRAAGTGPQLGVDGAGKLYNDGVGTAGVTSTIAVNTGNWVHVAIVWDRSGALVRQYINGVADTTSALGATTATEAITKYIGDEASPGNLFGKFNGAIDEVSFWSRALSAGEIRQLYNGYIGSQYPFTGAGPIFDAATSSNGGGSGSTTFTFTHTPVDTTSLSAWVWSVSTGTANSGVTYGGFAMTQVGTNTGTETAVGIGTLWVLPGCPTGAQSVVITKVSGDSVFPAAVTYINTNTVSQSNVSQLSRSGGVTTSIAPNLTTSTDYSLTAAFTCSSGVVATPGANTHVQSSFNASTGNAFFDASAFTHPAGSSTLNVSAGSVHWAWAMFTILPIPTASTGNYNFFPFF